MRAATLSDGAFFVPVNGQAAQRSIHVLVNGGGMVKRRFAVSLSGPNAYRAYGLEQADFHGIEVPRSEALSIDVGNPIETVVARYERGVLAVDEHGAYFGVDWSAVPGNVDQALVNLNTWAFEQNLGRTPNCVWTNDWRLLSHLNDEPFAMAEGMVP